MPQLLLELFSEEIPARMQQGAARDLERMAAERLKAAGLTYDALTTFARTWEDRPADGDVTGGLTGGVAHVAYHLGAIRQLIKGTP